MRGLLGLHDLPFLLDWRTMVNRMSAIRNAAGAGKREIESAPDSWISISIAGVCVTPGHSQRRNL
jgi:hypothetical protein